MTWALHASAAWYPKSEPTFVDAIALVRRHLWNASLRLSVHVASKTGYATNPDAAVQQVHRIANLRGMNVQSPAKGPADVSPDRMDALVWAITQLVNRRVTQIWT